MDTENIVNEILNILDMHPSFEEYQKLRKLIEQSLKDAYAKGLRDQRDYDEPNWIC